MPKPKLPPAQLWEVRELADWNTTTFHAFLSDLHFQKYGIKYVPGRGGWSQEKGMLKHFATSHGNEILKRFIEECFKEHKPSINYPGLNFWFMKTYLESRNLPRVLRRLKNTEIQKTREETSNRLTTDEMLDLL